jgi:hypothetical protein
MILVIRPQELEIWVYCTVRTDLTLDLFILELSPILLLKFGWLLNFDFLANSNLFKWQNGEYSQWKRWSWACLAQREPTTAADLGSSHHLNPRVLQWANRVPMAAHGQLYSWWQWGKKYSHSSFDHLQRLRDHSSATLHRGRRASRGRSLASCNRVQVWAPTLHGGVEDSLHRTVATRWCQHVVGQLHRYSPRGQPGVVDWVL